MIIYRKLDVIIIYINLLVIKIISIIIYIYNIKIITIYTLLINDNHLPLVRNYYSILIFLITTIFILLLLL